MREDEKNMFLTDKQIEILRLKKKGMTQADIARSMNTSPGNICIIENTALKNIEKAKNTIKVLPVDGSAHMAHHPGRHGPLRNSRNGLQGGR